MKIYKLFCLFFTKTIDNSLLLRDELLCMLPDMFYIRNIVIGRVSIARENEAGDSWGQ